MTGPEAQSRIKPVAPGSTSFRLGEVDVFPESGNVNGPGGTCQLDPKVMQVLQRLAVAGGEIVSKDTLMLDVWQGTLVTDFALSRCIYQLRKNLCRVGETEDSPIETLAKRGYRLTWKISEFNEPRVVKSTFRKPILFAAVIASVLVALSIAWFSREPVTAIKSRPAIAVMPFSDLTEAGDLGFFGDGIAVALQTELGHIAEIDVIAKTSSFYFAGSQTNLMEIGTALDITYLVEGSVNREGESVQVTAALIKVEDGRQVWSKNFIGMADKSFTAQQDIATEIADYLDVTIGDPRSHGSTTNFKALEAYLLALDSEDPGMTEFHIDQALALDPDYANALVAKAFNIYLRLWQGDAAPEQAWEKAEPLLERAFEITQELPGAHVLVAGFHILREEYEAAEVALERALEINPSHSWAFVHLSRLMERTGRLSEAVELAERNVRLDPLNAMRHLQLANRQWSADDIDGGKASFERALELDPLNFAVWRDYCARLSKQEGVVAGFRLMARLQENPEFKAQFIGPKPELSPAGVGLIAFWFGNIGDFDRKLQMLELQTRSGDSGYLHSEMAWVLLVMGDFDRAREQAWIAIRGMPRESVANYQIASIALRTETDLDRVLDHYQQYWPGLFNNPPDTGAVNEIVTLATALVQRATGNEEQANRLIDALLAGSETTSRAQTMALGISGDIATALDELELHIRNGGYFSYIPGGPFWAPLADEPQFMALVESEKIKNAQFRAEVDKMISEGELILPGHRE